MNARITIALLAALTVTASVIPQGDSATAAVNVLHADCTEHNHLPGAKRNCVYAPKDGDSAGRTLRFRDSHGKTVTIRHRKAAWKYVTAHSHKCGGYQHGCYFTDQIMGQSVAMPDGLSIALRRLPR